MQDFEPGDKIEMTAAGLILQVVVCVVDPIAQAWQHRRASRSLLGMAEILFGPATKVLWVCAPEQPWWNLAKLEIDGFGILQVNGSALQRTDDYFCDFSGLPVKLRKVGRAPEGSYPREQA